MRLRRECEEMKVSVRANSTQMQKRRSSESTSLLTHFSVAFEDENYEETRHSSKYTNLTTVFIISASI